MRLLLIAIVAWLGTGLGNASGQQSASQPAPASASSPLPDVTSLLRAVEGNQRRMEAAQRDYTYHVHTEEQELTRDGAVKKTETIEAESLTLDGVRVNRTVAHNGIPLSSAEQAKEAERLDKVVAKAHERRTKLDARGAESDSRGEEILPLSRILELGSFSNPRRETEAGRTLVAVDYRGDPEAKTHTPFEGIMRAVVGTLWIDEADRVLVRAEARFQNDFKLGGGLLADVQRGSHFAFHATRVAEGLWLPATIDGQGSVRVLLLAHFNGRLHVVTSDYRRFRTSAVIRGSHGAIDEDGKPTSEAVPVGQPAAPQLRTDPPHP